VQEFAFLVHTEALPLLGLKMPKQVWEDLGIRSDRGGHMPANWTQLVIFPGAGGEDACRLGDLQVTSQDSTAGRLWSGVW